MTGKEIQTKAYALFESSFLFAGVGQKASSSMPVKLTWRQYGYSDEATDCFDAQVFKKGDNKVFEKKFPRTDFDNTLEVK